MNNRDIYASALAFIDEDNTYGSNEELEDRSCYILASLYNEIWDIDKKYREVNNISAGIKPAEAYVALNMKFPCDPRFASPASMYLAAMLVLDEDSELSDKLFDKYSESMAFIMDGISKKNEITPPAESPESPETSAQIESIVDRYF